MPLRLSPSIELRDEDARYCREYIRHSFGSMTRKITTISGTGMNTMRVIFQFSQKRKKVRPTKFRALMMKGGRPSM